MRTAALAAVLLVVITSACGASSESVDPGGAATTAPDARTVVAPTAPAATTPEPAWTDEEVTFSFGSDRLFGVLTWPSGEGPHPAVLLLSGSGDAEGVRSGSTAKIFVEHSRRLAMEGFVVLRYDPPGVGRSTGGGSLPSLDARVEETHDAIRYLKSLQNVAADRIGLQGWSQGPWVMAMTAVRYPQDAAFLVSVVGSGQSVAMQQVYGIRAQSQAAGLSDGDVAKAVLFGRLLIDWQLPEPMFEAVNRADAQELGAGAWADFVELLYQPGDIEPVEVITVVVDILSSIREEQWAEAVYPDLYLVRLESLPDDITPGELDQVRAVMAENLMTDPKDFLTQVRVPLLAFFGEYDVNVDSETSARLFGQYLTEAGNEDYTIVVIPDVGHDIGLQTHGYWETLSDWLSRRFSA